MSEVETPLAWTQDARDRLVGCTFQRGRERATIRATYEDIIGGIVLDSYVDGFRCWNLADGKIVPDQKRKPKCQK